MFNLIKLNIMADIPSMSLKVAPLQFATFTPTQYTSQASDSTLLAKSLLMQETREKESNQNMDAIDTALAGIRSNLNVAEHDWLDNKAGEIRNAIDTQIALGNYQSAIRIAQQSARDLKRDTDLQNKMKVNQLYEQERNNVFSSGIDPLTKKYWEYRNQYSYNGTADWKPSWTPVKDISLSNLQGLAAQLTAEDAKSITTGGGGHTEILIDSKGNETKDLTQAVGLKQTNTNSWGNSKSSHTKSKEDIEKTFRALLADSNVSTALGQKFDVSLWAYNDYVARSEDMSLSEKDRQYAAEVAKRLKSELVDENGILITDYDDWVDKKVIPMFKNMEYYNTATSEQSTKGVNYGNALFTQNIQRLNNKDTIVSEAENVEVQGTPGLFNYKYVTPTYKTSTFKSYFDPQ